MRDQTDETRSAEKYADRMITMLASHEALSEDRLVHEVVNFIAHTSGHEHEHVDRESVRKLVRERLAAAGR